MDRTLLVTNDFPPKLGGIQSYLYELASRLDPGRLVVFAPRAPGAEAFDARQPFPVVRHSGMLLPSPAVRRTAARLLEEHHCTTVWFGAAAPLGLLAAPLRAAGARRILASTHGHEVGWSMLPGARSVLREVGERSDVVTYVSRYARARTAAAFGPRASMEYLAPAVDTRAFAPDRRAGRRIRERLGLGRRPVVLLLSRLVPRKGADRLIAAMPRIREWYPDAVLVLAGSGRDEARLRGLAEHTDGVLFAGAVPDAELADWHNMADVFAMPCRTRGFGLDVEGFGLVFLEAAACGVPVIAGGSGGAPESIQDGVTGYRVSGKDTRVVAEAVVRALGRPELGSAGRARVSRDWSWARRAERLAELLSMRPGS